MDDGLKQEWRDWASYMTQPVDGFPPRSLLGRIKEEGAGAGSGGMRDFVPAKGVPQRLLWIHKCWLEEMDDRMKRIMLVVFGSKVEPQKKAKALGMSVSRMYELAGDGLHFSRKFFPEALAKSKS